MQLCVNRVQDWVSKNGFKFSTSMHFCNQRKHFAEPSILLDKTPMKVVTEATFLDVIFYRTLSYSIHVKYLKTNCLKALDWGADQKTLLCLIRALVRSKWNNILKTLDPTHYELLTNCTWGFSYFPSNKPLCESKRNVLKNTDERKCPRIMF